MKILFCRERVSYHLSKVILLMIENPVKLISVSLFCTLIRLRGCDLVFLFSGREPQREPLVLRLAA